MPVEFGRTYHQADGNHIVEGVGDIVNVGSLDIPLKGTPMWLVSAPYLDGILWVATLTDGTVQAFKVANGAAEPVSLQPSAVPVGMPPILRIEGNTPSLIVPTGDYSLTTHPVPLSSSNALAYIDPSGNLIIDEDAETVLLSVDALPDARILVDELDRLLLLTGPTTAYGHGVLGDSVEADSITLIETQPEPRIVLTIPIGADWVIEGIAPVWADLNGDGEREIIVTRANSNEGAQVVVFAEDGTLLATGPAIGQGNRWRHQLAVGAFSAENTIELVDVLTPHIGGHVEFYRMVGDQLIIDTAIRGYTSHVIGTRNLDMAVAGDWSGTGKMQLLLPTQDRSQLAAIGIESGTASVFWTVPSGGRIVTNLSAATLDDQQLAVGVGLDSNTLRIWQP